MAKFLIATVPITGHVNQGIPIAKKLVEHGHEVVWYTGKKFQKKIEAIGARYVPMKAAFDYDDSKLNELFPGRAKLKGLAAMKFDITHLFIDAAPGQLADLTEILQRYPSDVILSDFMFIGTHFLREKKRIPWVVYGILPLGLASSDTAPFGTGLHPNASFWGKIRNRLLNELGLHILFRDVQQHANKLRIDLNLPPLKSFVLAMSAPPDLFLQSIRGA